MVSRWYLSPTIKNIFVGLKAANLNMPSIILEPRREKTGFLHMRKQRRRSAAQ